MIRKKNGENGNGNRETTTTVSSTITTAQRTKRMILSAITEPIISHAEKIVIYGHEGIGKSTWAAAAECPVFLSTEEGLKGVKPIPQSFPEAETWQDILDAIETLRTEKHDYKTLVIDTADWTEHLCQAHVLKISGKTSIEEVGGGYGKGYVMVCEEWKRLLQSITLLRKEKQMNVIFVGHSAVVTFQNPAGDNFDKYQMKIDKRINALIKEWADAILFATYEILVDTEKNRKKGKAYGGDKMIHAVHTPAWDAKNRYGIETPISMDAKVFWNLTKGGK